MRYINELEQILNNLGLNWNLFGHVDKMKYLLNKIKEEFNN